MNSKFNEILSKALKKSCDDDCKENMIKIVKFYGATNQTIVAIEEMSELTKELTKCLRYDFEPGKCDVKNIKQEMADVELCLFELRYIFDIEEDEIQEEIERKLQRTLRRMDICRYKEARKSVG